MSVSMIEFLWKGYKFICALALLNLKTEVGELFL